MSQDHGHAEVERGTSGGTRSNERVHRVSNVGDSKDVNLQRPFPLSQCLLMHVRT